MDFGLVRPVIAGVTAPTPRPPETGRTESPTELAGPAVVTDVNASDRAVTDYRNRLNGTDPAAFAAERQVSFQASEADEKPPETAGDPSRRERVEDRTERDERTEDLVFKRVDVETGDVIKQVPEEVLIKIRATMRAFGEVAAPGRSPVYDLTA
ncbi:hypothetical protein [Methylobrevis albus]|uniref:Flagellar protein FlaG n=1 Tax=Methylobrevis albus TaxID=2793297 RepID=A0A931MYM0_9HYPH|nr:hypothetical protein [Methylobrevis albus]MBH0236861.1 hypothetical protein [Methylobrevis albus]